MHPQAKPAPPSPPKLHGRCKCQPSNPDEMNKQSKPNNSDPSDSEHPSTSRLTTAGKKALKWGKKKYKVHTTIFLKNITDFYSTYRKMTAQRVAEDAAADAAASSAHLTPYIFYFYFIYIYFLQIRTDFRGHPPHCGPSATPPNVTISPKPQ